MIGRGAILDRRLQVSVPFQWRPVHARLLAGFFDHPEISDVQKPEWADLFDFVPENQVLPFVQMNPQRADAYGSLDGFLHEPRI